MHNNLFIALFRFLQKRLWLMWLLLLVLTGMSLFFISRIEWIEDISDFLPKNKENEHIHTVYNHLGKENKILIRVRLTDEAIKNADNELIHSALAYLAHQLRKRDTADRIADLLYKVDMQEVQSLTVFLINNMPYFLSEEDYARMDTLLSRENIEDQLEANIEILSNPVPEFIKEAILHDPLHFSNAILKQLNTLQFDDEYTLRDGYFYNREGTEALLILQATYPVTETANNKLLIHDIDSAIAQTLYHFDHRLHITAFGQSMVSITNAEQIKKDSIFAVTASMLLILGLLIYFFRNFKSLLLIVVSIAFGFIFALGWIAVVHDTVSVIAIGIVSIILGIAANYPLHFLAHYRHNRNKKELLSEIISPLLIGNITTVGAFLSLLFISSQAMRVLGLFSSLLLVGTILFVLIFLPHLLAKEKNIHAQFHVAFGKLANFSPEKNKWVVLIILCLTLIFAYFVGNTSFETDMHKMNYMTDVQRKEFNRLLSQTDTSCTTLYYITEGKDLEEALNVYQKSVACLQTLQHDSMVKKQSGIGIFLPSQAVQNQKIMLWNTFWENRKDSFLQNLDIIIRKSGFKENAFDAFKAILDRTYTVEPADYFACLRKNLADNYIFENNQKTFIFGILTIPKTHLSTVWEALENTDESLYIMDNSSIITKMIHTLSHDFNYVLFICGGIVFVFLFFAFGRIELTLLAFLPMFLSWIWILGLMNILGLKFNIVTIILATFIFGQGDDYTIFITEGLMYEYRFGRKMLAQFKNSIILSALIMLIAIGILIFARHPAMRSLAEVTILGMLTVIVMAYVFPPLLFRYVTQKKGKYRSRPVTLWNITKTTAAFTIFVLGSMGLSVSGLVLWIFGRKSHSYQHTFRYLICHTFRFFVRIMPQVKFRLENRLHEDFNKPSIMIANHQSHFDLLYLLALSPKIICLTNVWAQKFPLYRIIIKLAGYFALEGGIENNWHKIQSAIRNGNSILIFPEGTRSSDGSILRFHKGAFHIAEKFNIDILPVITHGIGDVLPKTDLLLHAGSITLRIGERITPQDRQYRQHKTAWETTKAIRRLFRKEYDALRKECCNVSYYKQLIVENYLYKGKSVENRCRKILKNSSLVEQKIRQLPKEGTVFLPHCGQGEIALLCALLRPDLTFIAGDPNRDLLDTARNCPSVPPNLQYVSCARLAEMEKNCSQNR